MTSDLVFKGNHIMHDALQVLGGTNLLIEGNVIHDPDDGAGDSESKPYNMHVDGMHIYTVSSAAKWAYALINFTFRNDLIHHAEAMGIMVNANNYGAYEKFLW